MNRKLVVGGSIGLAVLMITLPFPNLFSGQVLASNTNTIKYNDGASTSFAELIEYWHKVTNPMEWFPGLFVIAILFHLLVRIFFFLYPTPPPP